MMISRLGLTSIVLVLIVASCGGPAAKLVKQGNKQMERGQYQSAIESYEQASAIDGADSNMIAEKIATAYRASNRLDKASPYYKQAIDAGRTNDSAMFYYAMSLKANGQHEEAKTAFEEYVKVGQNPLYVSWAKNEIKIFPEVQRIKRLRTGFKVNTFNELSTEKNEFGPFLYENTMYFASDRGEKKTFSGDGTGFLDIYKYQFDGASESSGAVVALDEMFNTEDAHEASAAISPDGKILVFARSNNGDKKGRANTDLFYSIYRNGKWTEPKLAVISDSAAWEGSPTFSADGRFLYYASDRQGGQGGIDLWRAKVDRYGRWGRPRNMGRDLNTPGDEMFPYVSEDGHLYFASDGHPGLGRLDLFQATNTDNGIEVKNMGVPVNSPADDFGITFRDPKRGYLTSNRSGGLGGDDIYTFENTGLDLKYVEYIVDGTIVEYTESGEEVPMANTKVVIDNSRGQKMAETVSDGNGKFQFKVDASRHYFISGEKEQYFKIKSDFSTHGKAIPQEELTEDSTTSYIEFKLAMRKIVKDEGIELQNIFWELNSDVVTEQSKEDLDLLIEILKDNPDINIELGSHTDSRGSDSYNQNLSERRAEAAREYILKEGNIEEDRITSVGYGETQPKVENASTEEEYQQNRRTEFKVIES